MNKRNILFYGLIILFTVIIFLTFFIFRNNDLKNNAIEKIGVKNTKNIIIENSVSNNNVIDEVSSSFDKNIQTVNNIINEKNEIIEKNVVSSVAKEPVDKKEEKIEKVETLPVEKEFKVIAPVEGEISKDFAVESLLYSETLKEWTTHQGIDIKADKTTIVKCVYPGIVESIKNDPRYGLTITINHENGFKTVYANLLTAEFITEGEQVEEGKTIATVGESASFESLEEPHLHFEILKDNINVNPTLYLK